MRGSALHLTDLVAELHEKLDATGGDLVDILNNLDKVQSERETTRNLLEATLRCKEVCAMMARTRSQIEAEDHYQAIESIEQIKRSLVDINMFPMSECIEKWLPTATTRLLNGTRKEADDFLLHIRENAELIGNSVLSRQAHTNVHMNFGLISSFMRGRHRDKEVGKGGKAAASIGSSGSGNNDNNNNHNNKANINTNSSNSTNDPQERCSISLKSILSNSAALRLRSWAYASDFEEAVPQHFRHAPSKEGSELLDKHLFNFAPLHKALHLYSTSACLHQYYNHYRAKREQAFKAILDNSEKVANVQGLAAAIPKHFDEIVGFFTIECVINRSVDIPDQPFSMTEIEMLWERACIHISGLCDGLALTLTSPNALLAIKDEILLLIEICFDESYGLKCNHLRAILKRQWDIFEGLQVAALQRVCANASEISSYQSLYVSTAEIFENQVRAYRLDSIELNDGALKTSLISTQFSRRGGESSGSGGYAHGGQVEADSINGSGLPSSSSSSSSSNITSKKNHAEVREKERVSQVRGGAAANLDALEEELMSHSESTSLQNTAALVSGVTDVQLLSSTATGVSVGARDGKDTVRGKNGSDGDDDDDENESSDDDNIDFSQYKKISSPDAVTTRKGHIKSTAAVTASSTSAVVGATIDSHTPSSKTIARPVGGTFMAQSYPFSAAVPMIMQEMHLVVVQLFMFAVKNDNLGTRVNAVCSAVVNILGAVSTSLSRDLKKDGFETPLSKACQIAIDAATLAVASDSLWLMVEAALRQFRWTEKLDLVVSRSAEQSLGELRKLVDGAQGVIFSVLSNKIEDLLGSLVFINFEPAEPATVSHESVDEIVEFLQITFMWLTHLPKSIRESVHFTCCSHVASGILAFLCSPRVRAINILCVMALDLDIKKLMHFSESCGVPGLQKCFNELHNLMKCLLHRDLMQFGTNPSSRIQLFPQLSVTKLILLLEKMSPTPSLSPQNLHRFDKKSVKALVTALKFSSKGD